MIAPMPAGFVIEIEQEVLGSLLTGADFRRVAGILEPRHFVEPLHRILFETIAAAHDRYNSTAAPIVAKLISEDTAFAVKVRLDTTVNAYIAKLAASVTLGSISLEASARKIVEQWARMALSDELGRLHAASSDPLSNPADIVATAGQAFDDIMVDIRKGPRRRSRLSLAEASENAFRAAEEARQRGSGLTGITWGLTDVNRLTGGLQRRDLTLIAARPSMGKSTIGLGTAIRCARAGVGSGFISLEMDADKLAARAITDLAYDWGVKVAYADVIRGRVEARDIDALRSAAKERDGLPLTIEDQSGLSMTDIRVKTESMMAACSKNGHELGALFVDHIGLIRPSSRYEGNRTNEIGEITAGLKGMAREYGIAVVALSQLNRALEQRNDKRPQLSDLRDSGAIEQDADTIIFLYREAYYLERERGHDAEAEANRCERLIGIQHKLEFGIAKQRNGPVTTVDLFADMPCAAVRNAGRPH